PARYGYRALQQLFGEAAEQRDELREYLRIASQDVALVQIVGVAGKGADDAACFGDQQRTGSDVPWLQAFLEEAVEAAGGNVGEVERGRTRAAQAGAALRHELEHLQVFVDVVAGAEREAGTD